MTRIRLLRNYVILQMPNRPSVMDPQTPQIRIDKWLWHARFFKSRTIASKLVQCGKLRLNRGIVRKSGTMLKLGDVLTFPQGSLIRVIEVVKLSERRGPASEAQTLYKDLSPPPTSKPKPSALSARPRGSGRPTKSERRAIDRLRNRAD